MMVDGNDESGGTSRWARPTPSCVTARTTPSSPVGQEDRCLHYDKAQGMMIQRIGAQPVPAYATNIGPSFRSASSTLVNLARWLYKPFTSCTRASARPAASAVCPS